MRAFLASLCAALVAHTLYAQWMPPPAIEWQLGFGGTNSDILTSLQQTSDGGYIFGGYSFSPMSGNKTSPSYGGSDFWLVRLDANTNTLWQRSFGGDSDDNLSALQQTSDGGYIIGGSSGSPPSGNKSSAGYGGWDYWIVRLNADGDKLWERSFGGTGRDELFSLQRASDGGFILGGRSSSGINGTKTSTNWGGYDFWVIRVGTNGETLWERTYGGSADDVLTAIRETADGGFILGGHSSSAADGTKTSPKLSADIAYWIVRVDGDGRQLWDRSYEYPVADFNENVLSSLDVVPDGGFLLGGTIHYWPLDLLDFWVVRIDSVGNALWDRRLAPYGRDTLYTLQKLGDGGFLLGGDHFGDFRATRLLDDGSVLWNSLYCGYGVEQLRALQQTADGGFMVGGRSTSGIEQDKTLPSFGGSDYWIIKLTSEAPRLQIASGSPDQSGRVSFTLFPGTTNDSYRLDYSTNLVNWTALQTNRASTYKIGVTDTNSTLRFYRAQRLPD